MSKSMAKNILRWVEIALARLMLGLCIFGSGALFGTFLVLYLGAETGVVGHGAEPYFVALSSGLFPSWYVVGILVAVLSLAVVFTIFNMWLASLLGHLVSWLIRTARKAVMLQMEQVSWMN